MPASFFTWSGCKQAGGGLIELGERRIVQRVGQRRGNVAFQRNVAIVDGDLGRLERIVQLKDGAVMAFAVGPSCRLPACGFSSGRQRKKRRHGKT